MNFLSFTYSDIIQAKVLVVQRTLFYFNLQIKVANGSPCWGDRDIFPCTEAGNVNGHFVPCSWLTFRENVSTETETDFCCRE
jgi:hypothetical protein